MCLQINTKAKFKKYKAYKTNILSKNTLHAKFTQYKYTCPRKTNLRRNL